MFLELLLKKTRAEAVNKVFPSLVEKYGDPKSVIKSSDVDIENDLKVLGLYRQRTKAVKMVASQILTLHKGKVPPDEKALLSLSGVAGTLLRKW